MTRKRRPAPAARAPSPVRASRKSRKPVLRKKSAAKGPASKAPDDPLDSFIAAAAQSLDLTIEPAWLPAVRENLRVILFLGAKVSQLQLPDDAEPAPVFRA